MGERLASRHGLIENRDVFLFFFLNKVFPLFGVEGVGTCCVQRPLSRYRATLGHSTPVGLGSLSWVNEDFV